MGIAERKKREFENREQVILGAALNLFDCDEWLSVTVEQIAEAAEIGKGTVYKHFDSKEDIYARLTLDFYYGLLEQLEQLDLKRSSIHVLEDIFKVALHYHLAQPKFRRVTQYCKRVDFKINKSDEIREAFARLDSRFRTLIDDVLSRGMENLEIPRADVDKLYSCMKTCFDGSVDTVWTGYSGLEKIDPEDYIRMITQFMVAGVLGLGDLEKTLKPNAYLN